MTAALNREAAAVILIPTDRDVIEWAEARGLRWYYTDDLGVPPPSLKVHCGCVTAYFQRGRLTRLRADADRELLDTMFEELAGLMSWTWAGRPDGIRRVQAMG